MATKKINEVLNEEELSDLHNQLGIEDEDEIEEKPIEKKTTTKKKAPVKKSTVEENFDVDDEEEIIEEKPKTTSKKKTTKKEETKEPIDEKVAKSQEKTASENFLNSISVDLNNIELVERSDFEKFENIEFILNGKSTYQVTCSQSCYLAFMEPLKMTDINAITNSTLDAYQSRMKLYQTIYSKINSTSLGKISFKDWLRITSYFDFATLLYGVYMQTFPGNTEFSIKCRHCQSSIDVKINNDTLVSIKDNDVFKQMEKIATSVSNPEEALEASIVNKYQRIILPDSKIIIDVQTPSLANHLDLFGSVDPNKLQEVEDIITTLLFIKNIYMIDVRQTKASGQPKYFEVPKRNDRVNIIRNLSITDYKELAKAMSERIEKYAIEYKIKDFPCTNCGKSIGDIPIDIETLLFQQILQL